MKSPLFKGHVVGFRPMKRKKEMHQMIIADNLFSFISFANLVLNQYTHAKNKDINDTIQAGTPQQLAQINAGPEHMKSKQKLQ